MFPEFFHVSPDKHLPELDEIAVLLVVNFDHTPWVCSSSDRTTIGSADLFVRSNNSERNLRCDFLIFSNGLLVIVVVDGGLEDTDLMMGNIVQDALLEFDDLLIGKGISLSDDGNEVDFGVESAHEFDINLLQGVTSRLQEIDACMDTVVYNFLAVDPVLLLEVGIEARLNIVEDWLPAISDMRKLSVVS
jgi:hypothetical protein